MTVTVYKDMLQHSDEWFEVRRGMLTASTIGQLIAPKTVKVAANADSRALVMRLAAERINLWADDTYQSPDMWRGTMDEPEARRVYAEAYGEVTEVGFITRETDGVVIGYSPDGLVADDGLIEVKSRRSARHLTDIVADAVPAENMAQIQCGLWVTDRKWCDYVAFSGGMKLWVKRVYPDPRWAEAIRDAAIAADAAIMRAIETYCAATKSMPDTERPNYEVDLKL